MLRYSIFSDNVYESSQLEKVVLDTYQNIKHISSNISNLTNLVELHFTYNPILNLPNEINNLNKLEILNLSHNLFTSFPEEIVISPEVNPIEVVNTGAFIFDFEARLVVVAISLSPKVELTRFLEASVNTNFDAVVLFNLSFFVLYKSIFNSINNVPLSDA
jgi:Leucine-rich repeat (LRR) protein